MSAAQAWGGPAQTAQTQSEGADADDANNGEDITRPQRALEIRGLDIGSSSPSAKSNTAEASFRVTTSVALDAGWRLGAFAQLPIRETTTTAFYPAATQRVFGVGDAIFQAVFAHDLSDRWAIGAGARLVTPTAGDGLGANQWQIMPGAGVRYSLPELGQGSFFVPAIRYALGFAGAPGSRRISEPQIAPTLNINLSGGWFFTFYPSNDIRINFGQPRAGQTGRLFLPFDALIGVRFTDSMMVSLEGAVPIVNEYPVYDFKTELRFRMTF